MSSSSSLRWAVGDTVELLTGPDLSVDGEAIGRLDDGPVVFVRGAAPFERVQARLSRVSKRLLRAEVLSVLESSPHRVRPSCPVAELCGGCTLLHVSPEAEITAKVRAGAETLARLGGLSRPLLDRAPVWRGPAERSRTRARLKMNSGQLGFRAAKSHDVVPVDDCQALHPVVEAARRHWQRWAKAHPEVEGELALATNGERATASFTGNQALAEAGDELLEGRDAIGATRVRPSLFSQASLTGNDAILAALAETLPAHGDQAVELHAGSGNFTRLLADRFEKVVAVESARAAVDVGRSLDLPNVRWALTRDLQGYRSAPAAELLLVDPPRAGLGAALATAIVDRPPAMLVYLSCHVGSMARDLLTLGEGGFQVEQVRAFNLYPRTPHMEWMVSGHFLAAKSLASLASRM